MKEDPRELAKRLAAEAKQRLTQAVPSDTEDPRALARRLAVEAKRKHQQPEPPTPPLSPTDPTPLPAPTAQAPLPPLSERAARRTLTAGEALAKARAAERDRPARQQRATPPGQRTTPPVQRGAPPVRRPAAAPTSGSRTAEAALRAVLPRAEIGQVEGIENAQVFQALWQAHRARAQHDGDHALIATASVLLEAIRRLGAGNLACARVSVGGHAYAGFVDVHTGTLLGLVQPADVYLTGT